MAAAAFAHVQEISLLPIVLKLSPDLFQSSIRNSSECLASKTCMVPVQLKIDMMLESESAK